MDPNPPKPSYQLAILLLISLEIVAVLWGNDVLLIGVLILIVIVAFFWIRYSRSRQLMAKYIPSDASPKEDWKGKTDENNNPL
jgi:hypothetical protein